LYQVYFKYGEFRRLVPFFKNAFKSIRF